MRSQIIFGTHGDSLSDSTWDGIAERIIANLPPRSASTPTVTPASEQQEDMQRSVSEAQRTLAEIRDDVARAHGSPAAQHSALKATRNFLASLHKRFPDTTVLDPKLRRAIREMEDARDALEARLREAGAAFPPDEKAPAEPDDSGHDEVQSEYEAEMHASDAQAEMQLVLDLEKHLAGWRTAASAPPDEVRTLLLAAEDELRDLLENYPIGDPGRAFHQDAINRLEAARDGLRSLLPVGGWIDGVAGFATGMVPFGDHGDVTDELNLEPYASRFARNIALHDTELPLSVGLFGEWGSGKTYFMQLLRQEVRKLEERTDGKWCRAIVPIRFNAWHYLDTNLWASLVTEIFDQLFDYLAGPKRDAQERLKAAQKVMRQIAHGKGAVSEMKAELQQTRDEMAEAKRQIRAQKKEATVAARRHAALEAGMAGALDKLKYLFAHEDRWKKTAENLGLDPALASVRMLEERTREIRSLGGRVGALWNSLLDENGRIERFAWLAGALVVAPVMAGGAAYLLTYFAPTVRQTGVMLGHVTGLIGGAVAWLGPQLQRGHALVAEAEKLEAAARKARGEKADSPKLRRAREKAARFARMEKEAEEKLKTAQARVRRLEEDLKEMRPERRLYRFIEERAGAKDYRQHLGLVSLVRRDFRELSQLFTEKEQGKTAWEKLTGPGERSLDRIVLYVDDLDRCQPDRVVEVLEAVHLLLDFPLFIAVVAVDPRWVKRSLYVHYARLLGGGEEPPPRPGDALSPPREDERQATPLDYLEKIFHIPFHLPPMQRAGFEKLLGTLAGPIETAAPGVPEIPVPPPDGKTAGAEPKPDAEIPVPVPTAPAKSGEPPRLFTAATTPAETKVLGIVQLEPWEVVELNRHAALIRTPRAAKRLLNTYRLVRAGLAQDEWEHFRANDGGSGECRVAMLLLAAAAGFPAVAREWFEDLGLGNSGPPSSVRGTRPRLAQEWEDFVQALATLRADAQTEKKPWPPSIGQERLRAWLLRVERFAF